MARISFHYVHFTVVVLACFFQAGESVDKSVFFPSGISAGDSAVPVADDSFAGPVVLSRPFPFFGVNHRQVWVNNNGAVSFIKGITTYTPYCGAMDPESKMIAPYWGDVDTRRGGQIFYRESTNPTLISKANDQIHRAYPNLPNVNMNWVFISTWDEVAFFGPSCTGAGGDKTNSFQLVLTTDGTKSFAIFYYNKLTWTTGTASSGTCQGLGGHPAKAGFDFGNGRNFFKLPGSCTQDVLNLKTGSNVGQPGVWVYRIDDSVDPPPTTTEAATTTTTEAVTNPPTSAPPATSEHPTTFEPTTYQPTTFVPTTYQPTTFVPTTFEPTTYQPTTFEPTTYEPPTTSELPAMTCPPPPECPATNPCGNLIQDIVEHIANFVNDFPTVCLGSSPANRQHPFSSIINQPSIQMLARMLNNVRRGTPTV